MHKIKLGKNERMSFSRIPEIIELPNLIEVQKDSYEWFIREGLKEVFEDVSPITDYTGGLILEFLDYSLKDAPKYSIAECKERDATYAAPLKVKIRLINKETGEVKEQEIFMGDFPLMTDSGTFIINGAERVVVSQLVRSPGVYYGVEFDKVSGKKLFSSTVIPNRGAWIEYETDTQDVFYARIDRTRKVPVTTFLRSLGMETDAEMLEVFDNDEKILATLQKDPAKTSEEAVVEIYKRLRPGEPSVAENARNLLSSMFFDPKRYELAKVGRYKYNKKLALANRIRGQVAAEDIRNEEEIFAKAGEIISRETANDIQNAGINVVYINTAEGKRVKIIGNNTVNISSYIDTDLSDLGIKGLVNSEALFKILQENKKKADIIDAVRNAKKELLPPTITREDIIASVNYCLNLEYGIGSTDDIDHLGNRRIRAVGELLQNQFRIGLSRMERVIRERMTIQDMDIVTPQALVNIRPVSAAIKEFFGSSQLSQFMDQNNPLAELTHKRRFSALGPGGLSRERAGFEVRDVHYSHYGRMCPIETPEGPNIGLIGSLSSFARINEYGFIETPYRKVKNGVVTDEIEYMAADEEDGYVLATATEPLDKDNKFINPKTKVRYKDTRQKTAATGIGGDDQADSEILEIESDKIELVDVSPRQIVSVATAMIPFLENDDANRALMGANMQRQAVPLLRTDSPIVGTGMEYRAAKDSGVCVCAKEDGTVEKVTADLITIKNKSGNVDEYKLIKFKRSNQGTCINQKPIVKKGEKVKKGDIIADGPSTDNGELALGKNILIGFMTWEGYNYEDAILISEKLVKDDVLTSIHIEEYESESRDTKLGPEEITRDIPNVGEDALKDLDERGIIRIGAEVRSGDILVGKVTPKGETELTAEERLLRAIFGEKAREVRDTSLRVPHGEAGIIVDVKIFTRENGDEMTPGVNEIVRVYIAQKRKISVGDKMAGRHGNKGVISRVLPEEDMPFLPDGTPLQIVLNPLGVPSRMNIGQVLEVHLGYAARALGFKVATPVFDGAREGDIWDTLKLAGLNEDGKTILYDGRTGEPFDRPVTVGYMYMMKLHHLVDDKIHARSTGPYSLVTQQPLGGKAQFGGQRFGEMEVWALEAYGASYTLQEILTVKSDDVVGRVKTYEAIVKGENVPEAGIPESFRVLVKELQSLGLDVKVYSENNDEVTLKEYEEEEFEDLPVNIEGTEDLQFVRHYEEPADDVLIEEADDEDFEDEEEPTDEVELFEGGFDEDLDTEIDDIDEEIDKDFLDVEPNDEFDDIEEAELPVVKKKAKSKKDVEPKEAEPENEETEEEVTVKKKERKTKKKE